MKNIQLLPYEKLVSALRSAYDRIARSYEDSFEKGGGRYYSIGKEELESIITIAGVDNTDYVLEVGCGTGRLTRQLSDKCREVYAVDISLCMLRILRTTLHRPNVFTAVADARSLPFRRSFDLVICMGMFDYYRKTDIVSLLAEFRGLLRKSGRIVFTVQNNQAKGISQYVSDSGSELGVPIYSYVEEEVRHICARVGLKAKLARQSGLQIQVLALP